LLPTPEIPSLERFSISQTDRMFMRDVRLTTKEEMLPLKSSSQFLEERSNLMVEKL